MKIKYNYQTFGLKENWINMLFLKDNIFLESNNLGKNQFISFLNYLRDCELYSNKKLSELFYILKYHNEKKLLIWSILSINIFFNSPTFSTFSLLPKGKYSSNNLNNFYSTIFKLNSHRTIYSAVCSLISTFEHTPIGNELKIGIVQKEKKGRSVTKEGGFKFDPYVILYAIYKYAFKNNIYEIDIDKIEKEMFSPQNILVIDSKYIKNCLIELQYLDIFTIDIKENSYFKLYLKDIKSPYEIIRILFEKENI
ncbi:MAG: hypothetical protein NUV32_01470 [Exilispira sp.]|jgi:hypothetical protein|nr:hypothetical protein [Exilispira sp.]